MSTSNKKNTSKCFPQQREAVILFADLINSSELANIWTLSEYDDFVKSFQKELGEVVKQFIQSKTNYKSEVCPFLEAEIRGDEICLKLYRAAKNHTEVQAKEQTEDHANEQTGDHAKKQLEILRDDVKSALQIAILMKRKWLLCPKNEERIKEGRPIFDIGIGINQGPILFGKHYRFSSREPGASGQENDGILSIVEKDTPEGYSINVAKRIETHSRELRFSQILVSHNVFNLVDPDFRVAFRRADVGPFKGISQTIPVYQAIGIGHFDDQAFEPSFEEKELKIYENAVTKNPDMVWLLLDLGHHYFDKEKYEESAEKYQQVINIIPDFAPAHLYLGRCWFRSYRYEEAVCSLERALQLNELSPRANNFLAVCFRRLAYKYKSEHPERCKEYYRKALELQDRARRITTSENPAYLWALNGLARTIAEAIPEARSHFSLESAEMFAKQALELIKNYKNETEKKGRAIDKEHLVLDTLGYIYLKRIEEKEPGKHKLANLFDMAKNELLKAIEVLERRKSNDENMGKKNYNEKLSEIHFHLALLHKALNECNEAKKEAEIAIDIAKRVDKSEKFLKNQYWYEEAKELC
ncbi:MAG: tetratricopeptide repeat protein [Candidatus Aminicenantes bacterium]|nr:MAG: tetratricopeptide repeat protein [Candidatus Aminicenantes bacterium]